MRWFVCPLMTALCMATNALADEAAFKQQVFAYLSSHHPDCPEEMKALHSDVHSLVTIAIDRDGKLVDERLTKASDRKVFDQKTLDWLKDLQPYPKAPAEISVPVPFELDVPFIAPKPSVGNDPVRRAMQNVCKGC
jgi:TonB family protein